MIITVFQQKKIIEYSMRNQISFSLYANELLYLVEEYIRAKDESLSEIQTLYCYQYVCYFKYNVACPTKVSILFLACDGKVGASFLLGREWEI
jgi:hypothetical protein